MSMIMPSSSLIFSLLLVAFSQHHSSASASARNHGISINISVSAVEAAVRDRALELLRRAKNELVDLAPLILPDAGAVVVEASALRIRSNTLWADGVIINDTAGIVVPPRVAPAPFARRVDLVFERFLLGSGALFAAPRGHALAAPVVALLAYDAASGAQIALQALGEPVRVDFQRLSLSPGAGFRLDAATARCVTFDANTGKAVVTHRIAPNTSCACTVTGTGHYGVAVRVEPPTPPSSSPPPPSPSPSPSPGAAVGIRERWWAWTVVAGAGGVVAVGLLAISVAVAVRWSRRRRREEMERRAMAGEELGRMAVRGSSMPAAKMARTRPELEDGSPLPWRHS
ncbi:uncharacterized protein LOC100828555 [Brachypodium distachyon]|uniref:uncharacterized protein LOC100828555 n=1 Tax=Brachypodium distachyon TaxID=15368 RepID=UPI0001C76363|nr:uncharacterized protein LOC100828555 [Brachypodium distachyon]|eukprot:XP_003561069.1 uncharacterized protein LOC100828555 [Brachypodium distachyon]